MHQFGYHVLYSTGLRTVYYAHLPAEASLAGDYNRDGRVDAADYTVWRDSFGQQIAIGTGADGAGSGGTPDGVVDDFDYECWKAHFGEAMGKVAADLTEYALVPEPTLLALLIPIAGSITRNKSTRRNSA